MANSFGLFLKQKRLEKNLTQKQLAKELIVSESLVSKWEKNVSHPDITLLPKLSNILGVTEHELITASTDEKAREEKSQARKWRAFSLTYELFFYILYFVALLVCFICNLAIDKTLSWFFIVLSAIMLSFTITNLPKLIKKHKLLLIPLSIFLALCLLLGGCSIYTKGKWFLIATLSVFLGFVIIFTPIYIAKFKCLEKLKKYNDFVSVFIDFLVLNALLIVIDIYCVNNGFSVNHWYFSLALPILFSIYFLLNIMMSVRFLKVNKLMKTSFILYFINLLYLIVPLVNVKNVSIQTELNSFNIIKANFKSWNSEVSLEQNIHLIIFLSLICLASIFLLFGIIKCVKNKKQIKK